MMLGIMIMEPESQLPHAAAACRPLVEPTHGAAGHDGLTLAGTGDREVEAGALLVQAVQCFTFCAPRTPQCVLALPVWCLSPAGMLVAAWGGGGD
jgi:hypothetical protein